MISKALRQCPHAVIAPAQQEAGRVASPSEFAPHEPPTGKPALERAGRGFNLAPHQEDVARVHPGEPLSRGWPSSLAIRWASSAAARAGSELAERRVRLGLPGPDVRPDGEHQPGLFRVGRHRREEGHAGVELLDGVLEAAPGEGGGARQELRIASRPEVIGSRERERLPCPLDRVLQPAGPRPQEPQTLSLSHAHLGQPLAVIQCPGQRVGLVRQLLAPPRAGPHSVRAV